MLRLELCEGGRGGECRCFSQTLSLLTNTLLTPHADPCWKKLLHFLAYMLILAGKALCFLKISSLTPHADPCCQKSIHFSNMLIFARQSQRGVQDSTSSVKGWVVSVDQQLYCSHSHTYTVSLLPQDRTPFSVHQLTLTDKILQDQLGLFRSHTFPCCQITSVLLTKFASNSLNYALLLCENTGIILRSTRTNDEPCPMFCQN